MAEVLDILKASIKSELLGRWLPGKEGGLSGLVEIAALVVAEVIGQCANIKELELIRCRVEELEKRLPLDECEAKDLVEGEAKLPVSQYYCTQCDHSHYTNSSIGKEHLPEPVPGGDKW